MLAARSLLVAGLTAGFGLLLAWLARACGPQSVGFAFLLVWLIMCWVTLVLRAFPVRFPASYYELRPGERDGRRYERLGVLVAKRLLRRGPLHLLNRKVHFPAVLDGPGLATLDGYMREAETNHVIMFLVVVTAIVHALVQGWWRASVWTLFFNVVINAYPVMLQRYNRGRLASFRPREPGGGSAPVLGQGAPPAPHGPPPHPGRRLAARSSSSFCSRALRVMDAARSSSARASSERPSLASRSARTLGSR